MKGNKVLVTSHPRGTFRSCIVSGTPKPGTVMEMVPGTADVAGTFTWAAYGTTAASTGRGVSADGDRKVIAVLLEDDNQGKIYSDAYASGDRGMLYFPLPGEELNVIFENQTGTGESIVVGDELMVDDGTGKLLEADSDAESQPFIALESLSAITADTMLHVMFAGGGA